ncbi:MAG: outer membrane beta-barrel protein [Gemmataceae bacterium]
MNWKRLVGGGIATLLGGALAAHAQPPSLLSQTPAPPPANVQPALPDTGAASVTPTYGNGSYDGAMDGATATAPQTERTSGLESHSLPGELIEDVAGHAPGVRLGPTPVEDVRFLMDGLGLANLFGNSGIRAFGWVEGGYTGVSGRSGLLATQPRQNRFGDEFLLNQIGLVLQKPLSQTEFDIGFNIRYFAGADAALGQPKGGIGQNNTDPRFNHDFRDLYLSAHLPILTEGGVNLKVGRMNTIIGYNGFLAPYRPFYSSDYQFFYSQDGAFTGALAQLIVNDRLDIWNGITMGANTFFVTRSTHSYCYIGQINYWLQEEKKTRLTASTYCGPDAIFAAPGMNGDFVSMVELRVQQDWSDNFTQVVQCNMGWDTNTPVGTGRWYGLYTVGIYHLNAQWDLQGRAEWFDDVNGTRTGIATHYSEVTVGVNWHPTRYLEIRPEVRGDFAGKEAFGGGGIPTTRNQVTGVMSAMVKF